MGIIKKIIASFDNRTEGFSARKLSAFAAICAAIYCAICLLPPTDIISAVYAFLAFALLCLGMVTVPQLIETIKCFRGQSTNIPKDKQNDV